MENEELFNKLMKLIKIQPKHIDDLKITLGLSDGEMELVIHHLKCKEYVSVYRSGFIRSTKKWK